MQNLDFLNLNTVRNYPIKDGLSRVSSDSLFTIPNDLIADLNITSPSNPGVRLFISRLVNTSTHVLIEISMKDIGVMGTFNIPINTANYSDIWLVSSSAFPNTVGCLTVGSLINLSTLPSGDFSFDISSTELLMRVFTPASLGVNYLSFSDSKANKVTLTGYVTVKAESNLQFRDGGDTVIMDAGENLGLNKICDDSGIPIKTINGVKPDSEGNFYLLPGDCVSMENVEYGILLKDSCGKPCVGCNEIGELTNRLISLESELLKIRDYVNNTQGVINQLTNLINYQCQCE